MRRCSGFWNWSDCTFSWRVYDFYSNLASRETARVAQQDDGDLNLNRTKSRQVPCTTRRRWFDATRERNTSKNLFFFKQKCEIYGNSPTSSPTFSRAQCCSHYSSERKERSSTTRRKLHSPRRCVKFRSPVCYKCDFDDLLGVKKICFSLEAALAFRSNKINSQNAFLSEFSSGGEVFSKH